MDETFADARGDGYYEREEIVEQDIENMPLHVPAPAFKCLGAAGRTLKERHEPFKKISSRDTHHRA